MPFVNDGGWRVAETVTPCEYKLTQQLWKTDSISNDENYIPCDPAVQLLGTYPLQSTVCSPKDMYWNVYSGTMIIAKNEKWSKLLLLVEWSCSLII